MKRNKQLGLLTITPPDYFSGYHRTVLSFPISNRMTHNEVGSNLSMEFDDLYECMRETHSMTEMLIVEQGIQNIKDKGDEVYFDNTNTCDDIEDHYIYFGLVKPNYSNGIMFCE